MGSLPIVSQFTIGIIPYVCRVWKQLFNIVYGT